MGKSIIKTTAPLLIICIVVSALLALTEGVTRDSINAQVELAIAEAQKQVLPEAAAFAERTLKTAEGDMTYYVGTDAGGAVCGYVFSVAAKGYGGDVSLMCGITREGAVSGIAVTGSSETPGVGKKAEAPEFLAQFYKEAPENGFEAVKGGGAGAGSIDAITGATVTSKAVTAAVNKAVTAFFLVRSLDSQFIPQGGDEAASGQLREGGK